MIWFIWIIIIILGFVFGGFWTGIVFLALPIMVIGLTSDMNRNKRN